jgi:multiple sugar transport system substrate-binding protein
MPEWSLRVARATVEIVAAAAVVAKRQNAISVGGAAEGSGPHARFGRSLATLAAAIVVAAACSSPVPTLSPPAAASATPIASPSAAVPSGRTIVRWLIGFSGSGMSVPERGVAEKYNSTNTDNITIKMEIVPNANVYEVLKTWIAAGDAPDIIGPVGTRGRSSFEGLYLDLRPEIEKSGFDLTAYEPALLDILRENGGALVGLPYGVFPGYIWYNKDIFKKAGLPPLPTKVGEPYRGKIWDWNTLADVAAQLTLDDEGRKPTDAGFDSSQIVQYGMDFQWCDGRRMASLFGGGSFVAPDGKTAQIPSAWSDAFSWYYEAIWTKHIVPNGAAEASELLAQGNSQSSGRIAMNAAWAWSVSSIASNAERSKVKSWDIAVVPSWKGNTSSPADINTLGILKTTKSPSASFKAMLAIMADRDLQKYLGGESGRIVDRAKYFAEFDATLAPIFPGIKVTWSVLGEMAKYPAIPSHESNMPAFTQASNDYSAFYTKLQKTPALDVSVELSKLRTQLQADFDAAEPPLNPY